MVEKPFKIILNLDSFVLEWNLSILVTLSLTSDGLDPKSAELSIWSIGLGTTGFSLSAGLIGSEGESFSGMDELVASVFGFIILGSSTLESEDSFSSSLLNLYFS